MSVIGDGNWTNYEEIVGQAAWWVWPMTNLWQNHERTWGQILSLFSFPPFDLLLFSLEKSAGKRCLEDTVQRTNRSRESRAAHKELLISHQFPWLAQCCRLVNLRVDSEKMNLQGTHTRYEVFLQLIPVDGREGRTGQRKMRCRVIPRKASSNTWGALGFRAPPVSPWVWSKGLVIFFNH